MRGGPSVLKRMRTVSGIYRAQEERRINRLLCEWEGIDPDAFEADRRWWEQRLKQANAATRTEQLALVADELGVPLAVVEATAIDIVETRRFLGG